MGLAKLLVNPTASNVHDNSVYLSTTFGFQLVQHRQMKS